MASERSTLSREEADAWLRDHRLSEQIALEALVSPPDSCSSDDALAHAWRRARERGLDALDAIGWLDRLVGGFLVDDSGFNKARDIAPYATPKAQAAWLNQWQRPELWLAAVGDRRAPHTFPVLLKAVTTLSPSPPAEAVAAVLWRALDAADQCAWEAHRAAEDGNQGSWTQETWADLSAQLSDPLVPAGGELGRSLAEEALVLGLSTSGPPRHTGVTQIWCTELAKRIPEAVFNRLLERALEPGHLAVSSLKAAALSALSRVDADSQWPQRVLDAYLAMPAETWRGHFYRHCRDDDLGSLAGMVGACLATVPQPQEQWCDSWRLLAPGPPEGWPRDLKDWEERADAAAHLELVGILASLGCGPESRPGVTIKNPELFRSVQAKVHERLDAAAGRSSDRDELILQVLWGAGGDTAIHATCEAIRDWWVLERVAQFDPCNIDFGPTG